MPSMLRKHASTSWHPRRARRRHSDSFTQLRACSSTRNTFEAMQITAKLQVLVCL